MFIFIKSFELFVGKLQLITIHIFQNRINRRIDLIFNNKRFQHQSIYSLSTKIFYQRFFTQSIYTARRLLNIFDKNSFPFCSNFLNNLRNCLFSKKRFQHICNQNNSICHLLNFMQISISLFRFNLSKNFHVSHILLFEKKLSILHMPRITASRKC